MQQIRTKDIATIFPSNARALQLMPTEQQDAAPQLKLPKWLPHVVKLAAERIYERQVRAGNPEHIGLLNSLTRAERMKNVWHKLHQRRNSKSKSPKTFTSPANFYFISLA